VRFYPVSHHKPNNSALNCRKISADLAFAYASNIDYGVQDISQSYDISCQHLKRLQKSCLIHPEIPIDELSNKPANPGPELSAVDLDLGERSDFNPVSYHKPNNSLLIVVKSLQI
jgi:hypothetical protein